MASKNPTNDIAANILLDGVYDPCTKFPENDTFWAKHKSCDVGFTADNISGYCYMLLPNKKTLLDGDKFCKKYHDAELVSFDKSSEVDGFFKLFAKGKE
jgi:hypothetical protein